jgi:general stress protein YciG
MSESSEQSEFPGAHAVIARDEEGGVVEAPRKKQRRGFAAMSIEKQREIARKGGRASHEKGTGHEWNPESARAAGRKGGLASRGTPKTPAK